MDGGLARRSSGLMASFEKIPVEDDPDAERERCRSREYPARGRAAVGALMFRDNTKRMTAAEYAAFAGRELPNTADTSASRRSRCPPRTAGRFALGRLKTAR
jgi:hypothetical protein